MSAGAMERTAMRFVFTLAAALFVLATPTGATHAANGSALNVIGFSADGRYFAFEQYGERDGDGQLFSEIVTIDVRDDRHEEGPIVETWQPETDGRRKSEQRTLDQVRQRAAANAAPTLKRLGIGAPGMVVAQAPEARTAEVLGQIHIEPVRDAAREAVPLASSPWGTGARLALREIGIDLRRCENLVLEGKPKGIVLTLEREGRTPLTLTHDRNIPPARGCPDRYGIAAVHVQPRADGSAALAVLIQYFYSAYEGHGRRFFAVTAAVR